MLSKCILWNKRVNEDTMTTMTTVHGYLNIARCSQEGEMKWLCRRRRRQWPAKYSNAAVALYIQYAVS